MGRPTDYKDEYCQMLIEHMERGYSFESFGGVVYASSKTLYNWCEKNPEFLQAKKIGENCCALWWEQAGQQGQARGSDFNQTVWIFNMKNRFGWRDKKDIDIQAKLEAKAAPREVSTKRIKEAIQSDPMMITDGNEKDDIVIETKPIKEVSNGNSDK